MPTPNEKKDLREAWNHLFKASGLLDPIPRNSSWGSVVWEARQEISDARRIIDRVEQGRSG